MIKNIIYIFTVIATLMLCSCSSEVDEKALSADATTITVSIDGNQARDGGTAPTRYIMEVYNEDGTPAKVFNSASSNHATASEGSFTAIFDKTKAYTCLFWADYGDTSVDAANLRQIKMTDKFLSTEAYRGKLAVEKGKNNTLSVKLTHAVAKVSLVESDELKEGTKITLKYSGASTYDVMNDEMLGAFTTESKVITVEAGKTTGKFFEFFTPATAAGTTQDITFKTNDEAEVTVSTVPLKQNYNTNLKGSFTTLTDKQITVSLDENWGTPNNDTNITRTAYGWYLEGKPTGQFEIGTAQELRELANIVNRKLSGAPAGVSQDFFSGKTVKLTNDIDLNNEEWTPIGIGMSYNFQGTFDGNGKTISNLKIDQNIGDAEGYEKHYGLFNYIWYATIKDFTVNNVDINIIGSNAYACYAGAVIGVAQRSLIMNVNVTGNVNFTIDISDSPVRMGGIIGFTNTGTCIINCSINPTGSVTNLSSVSKAGTFGGIAGTGGYSEKGNTINCYSTANMKMTTSNGYTSYYGGIFGEGNDNVANCYSSGNISASVLSSTSILSYFGGVCGYAYNTISNCFALNEKIDITMPVSNSFSIGNVTGKATNFNSNYANPDMDYTSNGVSGTTFNGQNGDALITSTSAPWWKVSAESSIVDALNKYVDDAGGQVTVTINKIDMTVPLKQWKEGTSKKCPAVFAD